MNQIEKIEEIDVLTASFAYLIKRDVTPYQISIASGKDIDYKTHMNRILEPFKAIGRELIVSGKGADVIGISETEWWQIECKGSGLGKKQTQRNSFDRALSSVVSYYETRVPTSVKGVELPEKFKNAKPYLGLALPATSDYLNELIRRVRRSLRKALNLWILLYEFKTKSIRPISPIDEY